jgi:hypothetical protein
MQVSWVFVGKKCQEVFPEETRGQVFSIVQRDGDFLGPVTPTSIRGKRFGLIILDPKSDMMWNIPIKHKDENTKELQEILVSIRNSYSNKSGDRILCYFRSDNENVWNGSFRNYLDRSQIISLRPPPYTPAMTGKVERAIRGVVCGLRSMMVGVGQRLWCFALEHYGVVHNDVSAKRNNNYRTPVEQVERDLLVEGGPRSRFQRFKDGREPLASREERLCHKYRRPGCLCTAYVEDAVLERGCIAKGEPVGKFCTDYLPGVYLGTKTNPPATRWPAYVRDLGGK